jgi:DNA helicase-2/ATP-dependent DNA helicase PcrA
MLGKRAERAFEAWLKSQGYAVTSLTRAEGNSVGTEAPLLSHGANKYRAPDFETARNGTREFWEVKYRTRPLIDQASGLSEHRTDRACFDDYGSVQEIWGATVWIVVYEAATASSPGRWLRISVDDVYRTGRRALCPSADDGMVESQVWPVHEMESLPVPALDERGAEPPIVSDDESPQPRPTKRYSPFERRLRERSRSRATGSVSDAAEPPFPTPPEFRTLQADPTAALDVLRRDLGIPSLPRYSVLMVGGKGAEIRQVLGLLDYGIRLFLVTESRDEELWASLKPFEQARLLEWECVPGVGSETAWIVDGAEPADMPTWLRDALSKADTLGGLNLRQYRIVHAGAGEDVLVTAGAGTGKTETMSERLVFLLSTVNACDEDAGHGPSTPHTLGLDEVGLVTFTREAAKEMRRRIARTIMLRQRLCPQCVHPTAAWLMQLGSAQISTIHMFARGLVRQFGSVIGMGPGFAISSRTMQLRAHLRRELAERLAPLFAEHGRNLPPLHLWINHAESVWEALENNGVPLLSLGGTAGTPAPINWGSAAAGDARGEAVRIIGDVIEAVGRRLGEECVREQFLRTSQLVPAALQSVMATSPETMARRRKRLRFLFVDEFQDTDAMQLRLLLKIRERMDARLFVVGDAKQGIYRFRGASGNAFDAIRQRVKEERMDAFRDYSLTRNFRSDGALLDSMHPYFLSWGEEQLLPYQMADRLIPRQSAVGRGVCAEMFRVGNRSKCLEYAAQLAEKWRSQDEGASIAILCRRNSHAMAVHRAIKAHGGACELLVGGGFFTCEAARELRALLEAVLDPSNIAALLELCETRWSGALLSGTSPWRDAAVEAAWGTSSSAPMGWGDRVSSLANATNFDRSDLEPLQRRIEILADRCRSMSAIAFIVECTTKLDPAACTRVGPDATPEDDSADREAYSRNLDHLITLIDMQFMNSSATTDSILEWLRIQIATNRNEDEPTDVRVHPGTTTALTVHKSKGLEFDRVIVASTDTEYGPPAFSDSEAFVTKEEDGRIRVWWRWTPYARTTWTNAEEHEDGWVSNETETAREEARLLYVAMTRAKSRLTLLRPHPAPRHDCWNSLLERAEGQA